MSEKPQEPIHYSSGDIRDTIEQGTPENAVMGAKVFIELWREGARRHIQSIGSAPISQPGLGRWELHKFLQDAQDVYNGLQRRKSVTLSEEDRDYFESAIKEFQDALDEFDRRRL